MASFGERMMGAARLDVATYEEVEADRTATGQALTVVVLSSIATGVGSLGSQALLAFVVAVRQALDYRSTLRAVGVCVIGWFVWLVFSLAVAILLMLFGAR